MEFLILGSERCGAFSMANALSFFLRKIGLKFVTENFATFFTASAKKFVIPFLYAFHSGGVLT